MAAMVSRREPLKWAESGLESAALVSVLGGLQSGQAFAADDPRLQRASLSDVLAILEAVPVPMCTVARKNGVGYMNHSMF